MITRILFFIGTTVAGLGIIIYTLQWVSWTGKSSWAENNIGSGGTYTMWKGISILIIIFGFLVLIGQVKLGPSANQVPVEENIIQTQ